MNFSTPARRCKNFLKNGALFVFALVFVAMAACSRPAVIAEAPPPVIPLAFIGEWGIRGTEPGQLNHPEWISPDFAGNVFVADSGSGFVQKFSADGRPLLAFDDGVPRNLSCVMADSGGGIYVLAPNVNTLFLYSPEGEMFLRYPLAPQRPKQKPETMAVSSSGDIFVIVEFHDPRKKTGANLSEVRQYNFRGKYLRTLAIPPGASGGDRDPAPKFAAEFMPGALGTSPDGRLYVIDTSATRVAKFNFDGGYEAGWSAPGPAIESLEHTPSGIGIGVTSKYIFAPNAQLPGVRVWTLDGQEKIVDDLGGRLARITGQYQIAVSPKGELLALDLKGVRVLRFHINF
jgi:DNA-binding beta-propeller fold protein YncE